MLYLIRLATLVILATTASLAQGWVEPHPLKLGSGAALLFSAVCVAVLWITRTRPVKGIQGRESLLREFLLGAVAAAIWIGSMHLYFEVAHRIPWLSAMVLDRSREETEKNAAMLEAAGNHRAAGDLLLKSLEQPLSRGCAKSFAERTVLNFTRASMSLQGKARDELLRKTMEVAARFQIPDDFPKQVLADSNQEQAVNELRRQVDLLRVTLKRVAERMLFYTASIGGNVIDGNLTAARLSLLHVIGEAKVGGHAEQSATTVLRKLEAAILAGQPQDLPQGATSRIVRLNSNLMPGMLLLDIELLDVSGKPLTGLVGKDFLATQKGQRLRTQVASVSRSETLICSILVDISASTEGDPIRATKLAVPEFITRLPVNTSLRISSFSDKRDLLVDFTKDRQLLVSASQGIRAGGGTALHQSAYEEIQILAPQPGVRVLVVFTDGANSLPGPRVEDIIHAARVAKVAVHFVALKGAGYSDTSAIERIARETGGKIFHVQEPAKLMEAFRALANSLQETGYRLGLFDYDATAPLQVTIGGERAVRLAIESTSEVTPPLTQRVDR